MIQVDGLTKRYGDVIAVNDLSFSVKPGIVTGFLGPNGAGKSTTMRTILGLDNPTSGSSTINGKSYHDLPAPLHEVGAVLDAKAVHGGRTARNHLRWVAQAAGIPMSRADEVLAQVGLKEVANKKAGGFSLGMSQRLGIATALIGDPEVLLFDEPVNGLDPEGILWIRNLMKRLANEGRTVFVSSHLMSEMEATAEHVLVIGKGQLVADTSIGEFMQAGSGASVRVVTPQLDDLRPHLDGAGATVAVADDGAMTVSGVDASQIGEIAAMHRITLHELAPQRANLETAFMELTRDSVEYSTNGSGDAAAETARSLAATEDR